MNNKNKIEILDENNCIHQYASDNTNPWAEEDKLSREKELDNKIDKILRRDRKKIDFVKRKENNRTIIGLISLIIGLILIILGILFGDLEGNLLPKAVKFCLECIGIG